ncbi:16S rRNA (cytidine(1402)-2'-O)-methyltransferase [Devosia sp.]|uniref:16S rRNA (cytidine(1402)-2'-O)-methyltransferase n=1 Tax=Devosia sp. TaxID=1871048 RepID=UPI0025B7DA73|nr:16S rRNA (cytidine(1402)-2'-O)-methyltransferase [Devosia sp.]
MDERPHSYFIAGTAFAAPPLAAGLYVVATPIGNLKDITLRALETLAAADLVLCEDTRHSATLLDHYGIRTPRKSLHEHNERARVGEVIAAIGAGRAVAQISDAGTPLLSDPGFPLVRAVREAGLPVFALPGPSALLAALASAGLPTDTFGFIGFLPAKAGARANALAALRARGDTLVFYESPRRLGDTLAAMADAFGDRPAAVALELTKRFERVERGTLADLARQFGERETKGEAVILVGGAEGVVVEQADWQAALADALVAQPLRAAVDEITARYGLKRKDVYDAALALKAQE